MKRKNAKKLIAAAVSVAMCAAAFVGMAYSASAAQELNPTITYTGGDYTFEKISHPKSPQETTDGIVDYVGNGSISEYIDGVSEGNGDRGQSYSYASAVHGDWVYINTMYGGLGAASILKGGMKDLNPEIAQTMMDAMYNGNMYTGEPDGQYAGGILLKFNVKTGESKILMSRDVNHLIPTFRSACAGAFGGF